jgi:hypothetical protein
MTYPDSPQVVGTRTLMVALVELEQSGWAGRLPEVAASQPLWVRTDQAAELVAAGLAAYAPATTPLPPWELSHTAHQTPGVGAATSNCTP